MTSSTKRKFHVLVQRDDHFRVPQTADFSMAKLKERRPEDACPEIMKDYNFTYS